MLAIPIKPYLAKSPRLPQK